MTVCHNGIYFFWQNLFIFAIFCFLALMTFSFISFFLFSLGLFFLKNNPLIFFFHSFFVLLLSRCHGKTKRLQKVQKYKNKSFIYAIEAFFFLTRIFRFFFLLKIDRHCKIKKSTIKQCESQKREKNFRKMGRFKIFPAFFVILFIFFQINLTLLSRMEALCSVKFLRCNFDMNG